MMTRWLLILLATPWLGGCGATAIVTPELKFGPTVVTLTTDITPANVPTSDQSDAQTSISALELGLRSTFHF